MNHPAETLFSSDLHLLVTHSWLLTEQDRRLDLGLVMDGTPCGPATSDRDVAALAERGIGLWECDLIGNNALTWTAGVFDLFGLPRGATLDRTETAALYAGPSRAKMERLRAYAIRHRRGFTLDAEIVPGSGPRRWMRLIAAPVLEGARVVRLHGIKQDVTALYR